MANVVSPWGPVARTFGVMAFLAAIAALALAAEGLASELPFGDVGAGTSAALLVGILLAFAGWGLVAAGAWLDAQVRPG